MRLRLKIGWRSRGCGGGTDQRDADLREPGDGALHGERGRAEEEQHAPAVTVGGRQRQ
ncbi:hypothetical protein J7E99_32470 [Streptomyces sp. ISL-44]|uniref:hypothetical protein n=1 Tax=Streptomyces sp. ISL-44 TaxID=2819184 RepID=UPI001BE7F220|nr:hypothetical protein [Streptomyces sp. ISL-44]MBT2545289.1 hypothetical protein [Streptomyces sp. ISL-44]